MFGKSDWEIQKIREEIIEFMHPGGLREFAKKWNIAPQTINSYLRDKRYNGRTTQFRLMEMHKRAMRNKREILKTA